MTTERRMTEEALNAVIDEIKSNAHAITLSKEEEERLELLIAMCKIDPVFKAYLVFCTDNYAKATIEGKRQILIDGVLKLAQIVFQKEFP